MVSPNYSILKPTVFVLMSIYAKVFEKRIIKVSKIEGAPMAPLCLKFRLFRLLFTKLRHFEKNGTRHFSLIGRHLESVSRTIPVFKHTLAPSEKWPTQEISFRFGPFFIELSC